MKVRNSFLLGVSVVLLTACGSAAAASAVSPGPSSPSAKPSPSSPASAGVDPCLLVTASEASSAAGKTLVNSGTLIGQPTVPGACFYVTGSGPTIVWVYEEVYRDSATANAVLPEQLQSALSWELGKSSATINEVDGIGSKAFEFTTKGQGGAGIAFVVIKGNVVFLVALDPTTSYHQVEVLAKTAAARLP